MSKNRTVGYEILASNYTKEQISEMARTLLNANHGIRVPEDSLFWGFVLKLQSSGIQGLNAIAHAEKSVSLYALQMMSGMN